MWVPKPRPKKEGFVRDFSIFKLIFFKKKKKNRRWPGINDHSGKNGQCDCVLKSAWIWKSVGEAFSFSREIMLPGSS